MGFIIMINYNAGHKPFVAAVQHVQAEHRQTLAQSWYHHHILAPAAGTLIQASLLLDAAPTKTDLKTDMLQKSISNYKQELSTSNNSGTLHAN